MAEVSKEVCKGGINAFSKGWFTELCPSMWTGHAFSLQMSSAEGEVLYHKQSDYQDVLVFQSETFGRVLVLDGIIQCTERDEFAYQEMITHIPLFAHPNPESVLVIGGGDGGVLREVAKHSCVKEIHLCEIDESVIQVSKEFLPSLSVGFADSRVQVHLEDGNEFMKRHKNRFDVIITDSSDPTGPATCLFEKPYFETMKLALKSGGVLCSQGQSMWLDAEVIKTILEFCRTLFPMAKYATSFTPTYPLGQLGYVLCSMDPDNTLSVPSRPVSDSEATTMNLKYYTSAIHSASFVLPRFMEKKLSTTETVM